MAEMEDHDGELGTRRLRNYVVFLSCQIFNGYIIGYA